MTWEYIFDKLLPMLFSGAGKTLLIFGLTLLFSIPLGMLVAVGKMSRHRLISAPVSLYILIMRGTPLLLQIIFVYFAPYYLFNFSYDRFTAVIIAFTLNYAAYFAEIFRGGIESIPHGQHEAAATLGFTRSQTFFHIILPQVVKRVLPASGNEVITLVKDTALAQTIGVVELFALAQKQASFKFSIVPLFAAGLIYFVLNWVVTLLFSFAEKKLDYYK